MAHFGLAIHAWRGLQRRVTSRPRRAEKFRIDDTAGAVCSGYSP